MSMKIVPLLPAILNLELLDFCNIDMHRCIRLNSINKHIGIKVRYFFDNEENVNLQNKCRKI